MNKRIETRTVAIMLAALMLVAVIAIAPASARPIGNTSDTTVGTAGTFTATPGSGAALGGNITDVSFVDVLTVTSKWQAYYGNVTGSIMLGSSVSDKMFSWSVGTMAGEVFATQDVSMTIAKWEALTARNATQIDTDFSFTAGDSDSAANSFDANPDAIVVAGRSIDGAANTAVQTYNGTETATWTTIALSPDSTEANYVFAGVIISDGEAYDDTTKDFQMIVPENEATGTETYYFYVELT